MHIPLKSVSILRRTFLLVVALGAGTACYTYSPVEQPRPGTAVRASLTVEGSVRQSEYLGEPIRSLSGKFVSTDAGSVHLDVITGASRGIFNDIVLHDTLSIPTGQIVVMEQREISWLRTGIVTVGAAVIAATAIGSLTGGGDNVDGDLGNGTTFERIRIPIFRIGR
jgi:hypothetical protein